MSQPTLPKHTPLSHLRVLDLTQFLSGPYATQILGDLGADVIKVESIEGDITRALPPHFVGEDSAYFLSVNRNKRSIGVNLKTPEGQALVRELALACDVVVENFRPGVLAKLGLDYEEIRSHKPQIIWCAISGFGQDGPYRDRPAYDLIVQAMSGGMSLTGEPEGAAVRSGIPLADIAAGMYAVIGILAAVAGPSSERKGSFIDIAMLDCQVAMLSYQAAYCLASGTAPGRQGRGHDSIPTYRSFNCGDGIDIVITANTERMWRALCDAIGQPELPKDPRFADNEARNRNRLVLWPVLEKAFRCRLAVDWVERLNAAGIPAAVLNTVDKTLADPQVRHREMVLDLHGPKDQALQVAGNPIKFRGALRFQHRYPPALAGDAHEILTQVLAWPSERIEALSRAGVIGTGRPAAA
jgi:CoA:oxalate CoA-transferase